MPAVNTGTAANAGNGDPLRDAFTKLNENDQAHDAAIADVRNGRTWNTTNAALANQTPPQGVTQINILTGTGVSVWRRIGNPGTPNAAIHQQTAGGIWWLLVFDSTSLLDTIVTGAFPQVTNLGGTENAITGTIPYGNGSTILARQRLSFLAAATNTGNVTFNNTQIRTEADEQIAPGGIAAGRRILVERDPSLNILRVVGGGLSRGEVNTLVAAAVLASVGPIDVRLSQVEAVATSLFETVVGETARSMGLDAAGNAIMAWIAGPNGGFDMHMANSFWDRGAAYLNVGGGSQPSGGLSTTALDLITVNGQSLSVGGNFLDSLPAVIRTALMARMRPGTALMLQGTFRADFDGNGNPVPITSLDMPRSQGYNRSIPATGLVDATPSPQVVTSAWPMAAALNEYRLARGVPMVPVITQCHGISGVSADDMDNDITTGTGSVTIWESAMFVLDQAKLRATAANKTLRVPFHVLDHGTSAQSWEAGRYLTWMWKYSRDYQDALRAKGIDGPAIMIIDQCGGNANTLLPDWEVVDEQLQFCEAGGGVLAVPQYAFEIADDNVHPDAHGTVLYAETRAWAIAEVEAGRKWTINRPRPQIVGNTVILNFDNLREDEYLFAHDPAKYGGRGIDSHLGFQVVGATITGSQVRGRQVALTCSAPPTGVRFAYQKQDMRGSGNRFNAHRSLLRTSLTRPSILLPGQTLHRWVPSFKMTF